MRRAATLCFALTLLAPAARGNEQPQDKLKAVEKAIEDSRQSQAHYAEQANALAAELAQLRDQSVAAARAEQQGEAEVSRLEAQLAQLAAEEAAKSADLEKRSGQSVELLMALQRLARQPAEALALAPTAPVDTLRSGILLGAAIPQIAEQARALRGELAALATLRDEIGGKRRQLVAQNEALAKQQIALKALTARKAALQAEAERGAESSGQRVAQLSSEAGDLRDLIVRLEAERQRRLEEERRREAELAARAAIQPPRPAAAPASDPTRPKNLRSFAKARGAMLMPVAGKLTLGYGETDQYGTQSKGLTIETRPGGEVVAPFDGRIEFAGPFRGYGQILIIEHGDGYHSLLAGLARIDGVVGQWLVAGEPVGVMPADTPAPKLYLELRHHTQPINPSPWLATRDDKVSG